MTNLIVLLLVWCTGIVLVYAWMLSGSLRKAFREEVITEPTEEGPTSPPADTRILSYAKPPAKVSLRRRWPILSALVGFGVLPVMTLPMVPLFAMAFVGAAQEVAAVCAEALGLTLLAMIAVAYLGLRDGGGQPAATNWLRRGWAVLCWAAVLAVVWSVVEWRTQRMLDAELAKASELGQRLEVRSADGTSAATIYQQAGVGASKPFPYESDWELMTSEGKLGPPPAFPAEHEFRVPLLRQAAAMQVGGLALPASEYWTGAPLPHLAPTRLAANLLRHHAISEARAGRIESAIADINAIHGMATHTAQGLTIMESIVACGVHNVGFDTLQQVLPFVQDPRALDLLILPSPEECFLEIRRAAHADFGVADRRTLVKWLRAYLPFGSIGNPNRPGPQPGSSPAFMFLYRTALGEIEMRTLDDMADLFPDIIRETPAGAARNSAAVDTRIMPMHSRSMLAGMMAWGISRNIDRSIQISAMAELSRAAVASTRFRLSHGRLPAPFDELVQAGLLPVVPVDPFSGNPMCFAAHDGYVFIYTLGTNRMNNGGKPYMLGRGGIVTEANPGFILSGRPLWELDLVPAGFVPVAQEAEPQ